MIGSMFHHLPRMTTDKIKIFRVFDNEPITDLFVTVNYKSCRSENLVLNFM